MRVLIAGVARCGSTWAVNVLSRAAHTRQVYEPDGARSDVLGAMVAGRLGDYPVLEPDVSNYWYELAWNLAWSGGWPWDRVQSARAAGRRMVRLPQSARDAIVAALAEATWRTRKRPRHVVVKSVNSMFSMDWIVRRYRPKVVVLRRNPLNIVSSWVVLNMWNERPIVDHPGIGDRYLRPLGLRPPNGSASPVTIAAWNVGLLTRALREESSKHPEWIVESHDDLCADPVVRFQELAERVGLTWTPAMQRYVLRSDDPQFAVHHGTAHLHPNTVTATTEMSRRLEQGTQFQRRLTPAQADEALTVLDRFELGDWGARG